MSVWQILEIEPTSDTKSIKRAYAKKLKVTRPDEDPKGFQDLHWAYKTALQQAEWMAQQQADDSQDNDNNDEQPEIISPVEELIQEHTSAPTIVQQPSYEQDETLGLDHTIYITQPATEIYPTDITESYSHADDKIDTGEIGRAHV